MPIWFENAKLYYLEHRVEINAAILFAALFALLFEVMKPASLFRAMIRAIKNKLSERSIARLKERITNQELYRANMATLSTERGLFLLVLKLIALSLLGFALAGVTMIVGGASLQSGGGIFAIGFLVAAGGMCMYTMRIASLDTRAKADEFLKTLDREIADLKVKLVERTRASR